MAELYTGEELRPLVHFTPLQGFMNDPNGLCKYKDTYFLFFQHNPTGLTPGNTHWGMATSKDLLHWKQHEPAICPDDLDGSIFSGSGVVDRENRSGLKNGEDDPILLFYTGTGFRKAPPLKIDSDGKLQRDPNWVQPPTRQCIAYSTDGGKSFVKYPYNPILRQYEPLNRDPKVNFVPEENAFVMVLFLKGNQFKMFWSEDLLSWEEGQELDLPGCAECPDLFQLAVDGDPLNKKWILFTSPENYVVGHIHHRSFFAETDVIRGSMVQGAKRSLSFTDFPAYAAQTFFAPEEDRVIQLSWIPTKFPGMRFQSQMSLPWELELVTTSGGLRIRKQFAREVLRLRKEHTQGKGSTADELNGLLPQKSAYPSLRKKTEARELCLTAYMKKSGRISFSFRGIPISYDHSRRQLFFPTGEYDLPIQGDELDIHMIIDRGSVELFACNGQFNCVLNAPIDTNRTEVEFYSVEDAEVIVSLWELRL